MKKHISSRGPAEVWRRLLKSKSAVWGLVILCVFLTLGLAADLIADYQSKAIAQNIPNRMASYSFSHWLGTDGFGRDLFARMVHGTRVSIGTGLLSTLLSLCIGGTLGAWAGYRGGRCDGAVMRIMDTILCIPPTLLALAVVASLGQGMANLIIALTLAQIPGFAKVLRSAILSIVDQDFIAAAKVYGSSTRQILTRHVVPNALGTILVHATTEVSGIILVAAGLSFIGMGVRPPRPEWGSMLSEAREYMRIFPHLALVPGIALVLLSLSINLLGDGLRDALDPRLSY